MPHVHWTTRRRWKAGTMTTTIAPEAGAVSDDATTRRRMRTPEERAEAERVREERRAQRRADLAILRIVDPGCETEADPPVTWRAPAKMGGEPNGILLEVARSSGRGLPGSRLVLAARSYDGAGPNGGAAHDYVTAFAVFRDGGGHLRRTTGVAIRRAELRDVAATLAAYADHLDAVEASNAEALHDP